MISIESDSRVNTITRTITVSGVRPIMFDRYAGDNDTKLQWSEKIYLVPGSNILCLPILNILSFFTAHNTSSAPKRLRDARKFKAICNAIQSFVLVEGIDHPEYAPFTRNGETITVGNFDRPDLDEQSGLYLHRSVARLDKGIPNPKERPTLPLPWQLSFKLTIIQNNAIKEAEIRNLLAEGGLALGFGTYRGVFGKFLIDSWE